MPRDGGRDMPRGPPINGDETTTASSRGGWGGSPLKAPSRSYSTGSRREVARGICPWRSADPESSSVDRLVAWGRTFSKKRGESRTWHLPGRCNVRRTHQLVEGGKRGHGPGLRKRPVRLGDTGGRGHPQVLLLLLFCSSPGGRSVSVWGRTWPGRHLERWVRGRNPAHPLSELLAPHPRLDGVKANAYSSQRQGGG